MEKILILFIALILWSCADCDDHTNPRCSNYIPCLDGEKTTIPEFGVGGRLVLLPTIFHDTLVIYVDLDTVLTGDVRFFPKEEYDGSKWVIEGKFYDEDEFVEYFSEAWHGKTVEVGLSVYEYFACLSAEEWRGSNYTAVTFWDYESNNPSRTIPIHGEFEGSYVGQSDVFTISVGEKEIGNLPKGTTTSAVFRQYYDRFYIDGYLSPFDDQYYGVGTLSEDRKILTIELDILEAGAIVERTFVGNRVE